MLSSRRKNKKLKTFLCTRKAQQNLKTEGKKFNFVGRKNKFFSGGLRLVLIF